MRAREAGTLGGGGDDKASPWATDEWMVRQNWGVGTGPQEQEHKARQFQGWADKEGISFFRTKN